MQSVQFFASAKRQSRRLRQVWETVPAIVFALVFFMLGIVVLAREVERAEIRPHSDVSMSELRVDNYNRYRRR